MQFDHTTIAVRERNLVDLCDLTLHVIRRHCLPLVASFAAVALPLLLLNDYWYGWVLDVEYTEAWFYQEHGADIVRFVWGMTLLVFIQSQAASVVATVLLGRSVFTDRPAWRDVLTDVRQCLPHLVWCQGLVRGVVPLWLLLWAFNAPGDRQFEPFIEVILLGGLSLYVLLLRASRPFINEIILLERNPLLSRSPHTITIGRRSRQLHGPSGGDMFGRWVGLAVLAGLLVLMVFAGVLFCCGVLLNDWQPGPTMIRYAFPLSLWSVAGFVAVVRFLSYLDLRIRHEGWEVELRLRAEAVRRAARLT